MEKSPRSLSQALLRSSPVERTGLAAALIVGTVLIAFFHAPVGAVLGGCSLALAAIFINSRRRRR